MPPTPKKPQKLPTVLSPEEVLKFLASVRSIKHRTILTTCYAAGLRVSEAICLKLTDIDSERMLIRVQQGKGQKCGAQHFCPYVLVKFMLRWQRDGSRKERWRPLAAT
ncbi:MAG TPA: tyrosine-type recombinase/integrase [Candidatus Acidoferrum sp.]|nr:tyrosine-type recombinase/integrase [Candidatus Acidoferrum sp.]